MRRKKRRRAFLSIQRLLLKLAMTTNGEIRTSVLPNFFGRHIGQCAG